LTNALIFSLSFALIAGVVFLCARAADKRILIGFALLAAAYLALDDFITGLPTVAHSLVLFGAHWNWTGKIYSIVLSLLAITAFKLSPQAVGLTLEQSHLKIGAIAVLLFIVWGTCLGLLFKPGVPDAETLAFQAVMPGISEELVYRGIVPALLLGLVQRKAAVDGTPWAVILSTAIVFGVWHGLNYSDGKFGFDLMSALFPFIGSIPGGWLRFKTGSLVVPILGHGLANVAFHIAGGLGA